MSLFLVFWKLKTYLVHKEPRREEKANAEEDHSEVGKNRGVDGGDVAGHGGDVSDSHPDQGLMVWKFI